MQSNKWVGMLFLLFSFTFTANVFAETAEDKLVQQAYYNWCSAIGTAQGDPHEMVRFYAPGAILLPTLSKKILVNDQGGLKEYFAELTSNPNMKCIPQQLLTRVEGDLAINSGLYTFSFTNNKGKKISLPARFTFVYKKKNFNWMIINHHSSKLP